MTKSIAILRTPDESSELAEAITVLGYTPIIEPILSVEYIDAQYPAVQADTPLIFTSVHGVRAFAQKNEGRNNPVYAVGRVTAEEARGQGFKSVESASGTADDLVALLINRADLVKALLYVRGEEISKDLRQALAASNIFVSEVIGYRTIPAESLSVPLLKSADNQELAAILFFSVRGGKTFASLIEQYGRVHRLKAIKALCLSDGVVQSLSVLPFAEAVVTDKPDRYGMISLLNRIFK